ncbi:hypothetical protein ABBQ32_009766 [Trebouxia sp. C0010 RCD-2024]
MSLIRSCGALGSAARKVVHHFAISQSTSSRQAGVAATIILPSLCGSQACKLSAGDLLAHQRICGRVFCSSPIQPNPLGSTNPSGVGINPVGSHSAADSESSKPNPLAATTAVTMDGPGNPGTTRDSSAPTSGTSEKPDPLAATTNVKPDTTGAATSSSSFQQSTYDGPPKLIVFGGNGFVGTRVCEEALQTGLAVVSINRSGAPKATAAWTSDVEWVSADALDPEQWREQLQGAVGVVSCLGGFGSNEFMLKICGEANVGVIREAAKAAVPRCAFISVHDYNLPGFVLPGYFQGKRNAEQAMAESYPEQGVCLRPGFIHGTRYLSGVGIPLGLIGVPLEKALGFLPTKSLASLPLAGAAFVPPVSVRGIAKAAVVAATDPAVPGGIMDVWQLQQYDNQ